MPFETMLRMVTTRSSRSPWICFRLSPVISTHHSHPSQIRFSRSTVDRTPLYVKCTVNQRLGKNRLGEFQKRFQREGGSIDLCGDCGDGNLLLFAAFRLQPPDKLRLTKDTNHHIISQLLLRLLHISLQRLVLLPKRVVVAEDLIVLAL